MPRPKIQGVLPVFQTPFHEDESIDFDTLAREIDWLFSCGADGVVMAMVSEVLRLSTDEREQVAEFVCGHANGRGAVIVSVGAESSHTAERLAHHAKWSGADAVMAIPPISTALDEHELLNYYERILNAAAIPVIVQDASGYVGRQMPLAMQADLFRRFPDRTMFKPEATPIGPRLTALHEATGGGASVFEGSGGVALVESHRRGVTGTMPGADLIRPLIALWKALEANNLTLAYQISAPLASLVSMQNSLDAFIAVEKHLLVKQGVFPSNKARRPVGYQLDQHTEHEIDRIFETLIALCPRLAN